MLWRFGILAALMVWLFLAGPAAAAIKRYTDSRGVINISNNSQVKGPSQHDLVAATPGPQSLASSPKPRIPHAVACEEIDIELRNGTRTKNLAHLTRTLLSSEGFNVTVIGNHIDFGAEVTVIYYQDGAESAAKALQTKIFPWATLEGSASLKKGVAIKVLLGSDLLEQPRMMARLNGAELAPAPTVLHPKTSKSGQPSQPLAANAPTAAQASETLAAAVAPASVPSENPRPIAASARTVPAVAENSSAPLPLKKVSYEPAAAEAAPAGLPVLKPAEKVTSGGIRRYRDTQGVWHVSNVAPASADAAPTLLASENHPSSGIKPFEKQLGQAATTEAGLPLKKVAWSPDKDSPAYLPISTAAPRAEAPAGESAIRRYCDSKGVIHIDNEMTPPAPLPTAVLQARVRPGAEPGALFRPVVDDSFGSDGSLAVIPAAWSGEGPPKLLKATASKASEKVVMTTEGGIRRWRDKKGVWHIKTAEYPRPDVAPRLNPPAGQNPGAQVAGSAPAAGPTAPSTASGAPLTTITAFRDSKGRLKITSKEPSAPLIARPPTTGATAPSELEPLIVEAAQAHKLPATLVRAVIKTESNFCSWAVSPKGAMGLMQLMPGTAAFLGVAEPFNPRENLRGGCRYLRLLIDSFGGNVPLALAAYNAGYQRVINCGYQVPAIKETQDFVTQVMGRYTAEEKKARLPWT